MGNGADHPNSKRMLVLQTIRNMAMRGKVITNVLIREETGIGRETVRTYLQAMFENQFLTRCPGGFTCPDPDKILNFSKEFRPYRKGKKCVDSTCVPLTELPPITKTVGDLLSYIKELEDRVLFLEQENQGLHKQFNEVHQELANTVYKPRVILPAMPDYS